MKKVSRREFAKRLAATPLGLAAASSLLGRAEGAPLGQATPAQSSALPKKASKTEAESNRVFSVVEPEPFAAPLKFVRNEMQPKVRPFALDEVSLEAGPLKDARDWNRGYMMRLTNDRLLHNFRVNAGLPSSAKPLGGWEAPTCEPARALCRPLFVSFRAALRSHTRRSSQGEGG